MNEALAQGFAAIIQYLGPSPVLFTIVILGISPWGAVVWVVIKLSRALGKISSEISGQMQKTSADQAMHSQQVFERQDKRFEQVVRMYEDNVRLVKDYEKHVQNQREVNDKLITLVEISTATQAELVETNKSSSQAIMKMIENNEFCPYARLKGRRDLSIKENG